MSCPAFADDLDLYAFGALERAEAARIAEHLRSGCADCRRAVATARRDLSLVVLAAPAAAPSSRLRARILASLPGGESRRTLPLFVMTAAAAVLLVTTIAATLLWFASERTNESLRVANVERADVIDFLTNANTRVVPLLAATGEKEPLATAYVDPATGRTHVREVRLPALEPGRAYQLWYVGVAPNPVSGGVFGRAAAAEGYAHFGPSNLGPGMVLALTIEPEGGSEAPTQAPFALGSIGG